MSYNPNSICFVYEYGEETWSSPWSLAKEFKRRGWTVDRVHLSSGEAEKLSFNYYDIIMTMDWKGIDIPKKVHDCIPDTTFKIRENGDTPQNFERHLPVSLQYNLLITPDYQSALKYQNLGHNCMWLNHFADTDIHKQYLSLDPFPPVRSTRGQGGSQFMDLLSQIMPNKFINKNGFVGTEYGQFLSNGDIVVQNSRWKEITRRIFEGMACGKLVITDRLPKETNIDALFTENVDIVYYDTMSDCISKINYYLWDQKARKEISERGHKKVFENHTQAHRVDFIIKEYKTWKENSQ